LLAGAKLAQHWAAFVRGPAQGRNLQEPLSNEEEEEERYYKAMLHDKLQREVRLALHDMYGNMAYSPNGRRGQVDYDVGSSVPTSPFSTRQSPPAISPRMKQQGASNAQRRAKGDEEGAEVRRLYAELEQERRRGEEAMRRLQHEVCACLSVCVCVEVRTMVDAFL
jgi:hypothetical protein